MEFVERLLYFGILVLYMFGAAHSLECKQCSNFVVHSDPGSIASKIGLNFDANPDCKSGTNYGIVTCPESPRTYSRCSYVEGKATLDVLLLGKITVGVETRRCAQVDDDFQGDGCVPDNDAVKKVIGALLSFLAVPTEVDGQICYCGTDFCTASPCDGVFVGKVCIPKWGLGLIGVAALVILVLLLTCCCCCCCTCCRRKPAVVYVQGSGAASTVVTNSSNMSSIAMANPVDNGIRGMENPGYNPGLYNKAV